MCAAGLPVCSYDASPLDDISAAAPYITDMSENNLEPSDKARRDILAAMLKDVPFDGWTRKSLRKAVARTGLPKGSDELYFPGGALDVIAFWVSENNRIAAEKLAAKGLHNLRIRDKVTEGVLALLETIGKDEDAARRAIARLSLPDAFWRRRKAFVVGSRSHLARNR